MTTQRDLKQLVRERQEKTGESYTAARRQLTAVPPEPLDEPPPQRNRLIETTVSEAQVLLQRALAAEPRLTRFGIGLYDGEKRRLEALHTGGTDVFVAEFEQTRALLAEHMDEIAAAADWIKRQRRIASFNKRHNSYVYKHCVERWFRARGEDQYVSNGGFIAAAIGLGYKGKLSYGWSPNMLFQFSEKTVALGSRQAPRGFETALVAWEF